MKRLLFALVFVLGACHADSITASLVVPIQLNTPLCSMLGPMCPPVPSAWDPSWLALIATDAGPDVVAFQVLVTFTDGSSRIVIIPRSEVPWGRNGDGTPMMQTVKELKLGKTPYSFFKVKALSQSQSVSEFTSK